MAVCVCLSQLARDLASSGSLFCQVQCSPLSSKTQCLKTQAIAFDIKKIAVKETNQTNRVRYHDRTGHTLPRSKNMLQDELDKIVKFADDHKMKSNETKIKVMIFNTITSVDIQTKLSIKNKDSLEVVDETAGFQPSTPGMGGKSCNHSAVRLGKSLGQHPI